MNLPTKVDVIQKRLEKGSLPPASAASTLENVRLRCKELLFEAIKGARELPDGSNDPVCLSEKLEEEIYCEFKNTDTKYKNRVRSRVANLKDIKNPILRLNFLVGSISPARMAKMTSEEMASPEMKKERDQHVKDGMEKSMLGRNEGYNLERSYGLLFLSGKKFKRR